MATATLTIDSATRKWVNQAETLETFVFYDAADPGTRYTVLPCANTTSGEQAAMQAVVTLRKAAGLDYPGKPAPVSTDTATVSV